MTANAPENLSTLRKLALQLINRVDDKKSLKKRRKKQGGMMSISSLSYKIPEFSAFNVVHFQQVLEWENKNNISYKEIDKLIQQLKNQINKTE